EPADLRRRAVAAAYADGTEEGKLRHRYEMAIDRGLRATIGQLIMLEKSGADLASGWQGFACEPRAAEASGTGVGEPTPATRSETEVVSCKVVTPNDEPAPRATGAAAPGSLGDADLGATPPRSAAPISGPGASISAPEPAGGGRSRR
ncbi:MAG TPA: hypothetical protein VGH33_13570, partial [Isosphaeraceae bacterium]